MIIEINEKSYEVGIEYHDLSEADSIKFFGVIPSTL